MGVSFLQDSFDGRLTFGLVSRLGQPPRPGSIGELLSLMARKLPEDSCILAVQYFLPHLSGYHVLVHLDSTDVVSDINHQGCLCTVGWRSRLCSRHRLVFFH